MDAPRQILLEVPNHHVETDGGANHPPAFDEHGDFVAYSPNCFGEQMVYVQRRGEPEAVLYHGDYAWQPVRVVHGMPVGFNAQSAEYLFIAACWLQSEGFRRDARPEPNAAIIDALDRLGATVQHLVLFQTAAAAIGTQDKTRRPQSSEK